MYQQRALRGFTRLVYFVFGALILSPAQGLSQAAGNAEKIQELEARIARLERTVELLTETKLGCSSQQGISTAIASHSAVIEARLKPDPRPADEVDDDSAEHSAAGQSSEPAHSARRELPPELLPEIGKVGAEVGLLGGGSANPFELNKGSYFGGLIDLPLFDRPYWLHGKVSYEILVGMSQSRTTLKSTSNVAQVANLVVLDTLNPNGGLKNVVTAVSGTGPAPFPVTTTNVTRLRLLQVVPFAFKYTSNRFDRWRLRPYGVLGFGTYITIHNQNPTRGPTPNSGVRPDATLPPPILGAIGQLFGGQAPFGGPLVAGQISQSPELEARGLPGGHGNMDFGLHVGGGFEYRLNGVLSIGFDARYNKIAGSHAGFTTITPRFGFHF